MTKAMEVAQAFALQIYAYQQAGKSTHEAARMLSYVFAAEDAELERKNHALDAIIAAFAVAYLDCPPPSSVEQEVISIARRARSALQEDPAAAEPATVTYRNWRGEVSERRITPKGVWFGTTEWHPTPQWFLAAYDHEKAADRDFALQDFGALPPAPQTVTEPRKFTLGERVTKLKGSSWTGRVVGFYSTALTPIGYAVESETETGSVQIYPEAALEVYHG